VGCLECWWTREQSQRLLTANLPTPPDIWWKGAAGTALLSAGSQCFIFITWVAASRQMVETPKCGQATIPQPNRYASDEAGKQIRSSDPASKEIQIWKYVLDYIGGFIGYTIGSTITILTFASYQKHYCHDLLRVHPPLVLLTCPSFNVLLIIVGIATFLTPQTISRGSKDS
jgi:hypothetical protein